MAQVRVLSGNTIKHDEIIYTENQVITDITDEQAQALIDGEVAAAATDKDVAVAKTLAENGDAPTPAESQRVDRNSKQAKKVAEENAKNTPNLEWSRNQLNDHARTLGIDPDEMPNKQSVLDAIEAHEA